MNETYTLNQWRAVEGKMRQKGKSGLVQVLDTAKEVEFKEVCHKNGAYYGIEVITEFGSLTTVYVSEKIWENA